MCVTLTFVSLALLVASATGSDRRPTISFITQPEIVTDIGGSVEMKCSVQYGQEFPVNWMKLDSLDRNNDLLISTGTTMIFPDPRLVKNYHIQYTIVQYICILNVRYWLEVFCEFEAQGQK